MRKPGDRVMITTGKYDGYHCTVESNVCKRTVDFLEEWANGFHVMLGTGKLMTAR